VNVEVVSLLPFIVKRVEIGTSVVLEEVKTQSIIGVLGVEGSKDTFSAFLAWSQ